MCCNCVILGRITYTHINSVSSQVSVVNQEPVEGECECPNGQHRCSHMAAVLLYAQKNWSKTDRPCEWRQPASKGVELKATEMFPLKSPLPSASANAEALQWLQNELAGTDCGLEWLLKPQERNQGKQVPSVEELLHSDAFQQATDKVGHLLNSMELTEAEITSLEEATRAQAACPEWMIARKYRLTASNFGKVLGAVNRGRYPPSLFKTLIEGYDLSSNIAVCWGKNHESAAKEAYERAMGVKVECCGLILDACGMLGCTPDGCADVRLLEVKCPYKHRDKTVQEAVQTDSAFCLDSNLSLKEGHPYYHQVQGQLWLSGYSQCDFVIWTKVDLFILRISKDSNWGNNLDRLRVFFKTQMAPRVCALSA